MEKLDRGRLLATKAEILDLEDQDQETVSCEPWRHGHRETIKVEVDGKPYVFTVNVHHEEGWEVYGPIALYPAVKVMKETWEAAKD